MIRRHALPLLAIAVLIIGCAPSPPRAERIEPLRPPQGADRILVLAPHPDDEVLGCGGLIQQGVAAGAAVRVVYLTHGDHNQFAFIRYRKWPLLTPTLRRLMGEVRLREAELGAAMLGLDRDRLAFLGFPDNGTLAIWLRHWGEDPPFHSTLTNASTVPYADAVGAGRPHRGDEVLDALRAQLRDFRPTRVCMSHPADANVDHRALFCFLVAALLAEGGPWPELLAYPVHLGPWPTPSGLRPELEQRVPQRLDAARAWRSLALTPAQTARKADAIRAHATQMAGRPGFLLSFARATEVFEAVAPELLTARGPRAGPLLPTGATRAYERRDADDDTQPIETIAFADDGRALVVRCTLAGAIPDEGGLRVTVCGHRADTPFAAMPKLRVSWERGFLRVADRGAAARGVRALREGRLLRLEIPWELLGSPEALLTQAHGTVHGHGVAQSGWRVLLRDAHAGSR